MLKHFNKKVTKRLAEKKEKKGLVVEKHYVNFYCKSSPIAGTSPIVLRNSDF